MPTTVVCFFVETEDQVKLEQLLRSNNQSFYDATSFIKPLDNDRII